MLDVEHRPVYGSNEVDEIICSCGWRGPAFALPDHHEAAAREALATLAAFCDLIETERIENDWAALDRLEAQAGYLTPLQFLIAVRNRGLNRPEDEGH